MLALGFKDAAKQWLDEAMSADSSSTDALAGMAGYYAVLGRWPETESYADKALEVAENSIPALQRKYLALRGTKHFLDAFKVSERLLKAVPEEQNHMLLLEHAHIAHEAKQYGAEIAALTRLIALAAAAGRPTGNYEFELGQAYSFSALQDEDHGDRAIEHYQKALTDKQLAPDRRKFADEQLKLITERMKAVHEKRAKAGRK
jgi:tetratricopeptide (TPR) repeat protein